jgi:hypothetical protein
VLQPCLGLVPLHGLVTVNVSGVWFVSPTLNPSTWRTRDYTLSDLLRFDLSDIGGSTRSLRSQLSGHWGAQFLLGEAVVVEEEL